MGCCNIKSLPGVNDNKDRNGTTAKNYDDNDDDLYIDNHIKAYNLRNSIDKKFEFAFQETDANKNNNNHYLNNNNHYLNNNKPDYDRIHTHESNLMSNKDLIFKIRDSDPKKTYNCLRATKTAKNLNTGNLDNTFNKKNNKSNCIIFENSENILKIKVKLEFFNLSCPFFFSYFNFDFINDMVPEIIIQLKENKQIFRATKFNENVNTLISEANDMNMNLSKSGIEENNVFSKLRRNSNLAIGKSDNKIAKSLKFSFDEKNIFEAEYEFPKLKNTFICIYLYAKNNKSELNPYLIGEAFLPINFLIFQFDYYENILDVPIINKTENIIIGNLTIDMKTSESIIKSQSDIDLQISKKYFENYFKTNTLNVDFYENLNVRNSKFNFDIFVFSNIKIRINGYIKKYEASIQKKDVVRELVTFISEKDLNRTRDISFNPESKGFITGENSNEKEKLLKIEGISFSKYYSLLSFLNDYLSEIIIKQKINPNEKKNVKKPEFEFLFEKLIYSPFLEIHQYECTEDEEFDLMMLTNSIFTFIVNLHRANFITVEISYADCTFIFRDLGSLFAKSQSFLVKLFKEEIKNNPDVNSVKKIINIGKSDSNYHYNIVGMKNDCYYSLLLDNIYKYLYIVNSTIDLYIKNLRDDPDKKNIAKNEIRFATLMSNYRFFLFGSAIFTNDIFIVNSVMNIFSNMAKYGKIYATIYRLNKIECYGNFFSDLLANNSDFFKDVFVRFYSSHIFFKTFIEFGEIITNGSPTYIKFNFLNTINLKTLFQRFNIEAKAIESKKFYFWNNYLNLILNILSSLPFDHFVMVDFYYFNYTDIVVHFTGLFIIIVNYPYFKTFSSNEISFDMENLAIIRGNPEIITGCTSPTNIATTGFNLTSSSANNFGFNKKFLGTFQSLLIFSSIFDIFYEFIVRKYFMNPIVEKYKKVFMGVFEKMFFVVFYNVEIYDDKYKNEIKVKLYSIYTRILRILFKMQTKYNFNLQSFVRESFRNIFQKDNKEIKVVHLIKKLMQKIIENKPEKQDKSDKTESRELIFYKEMAEEIIKKKQAENK